MIYTPSLDSIFLEQYIHHEFSSILINKYSEKFKDKKWERINRNKFRYMEGGGEEAIETDNTSQYSEELFRAGFIMKYATASVEEDFNCIAESLFSCYGYFWTSVKKHRRLGKKVKRAIAFYHSIDPVFSKDFFRRISKW